MKILIELKDYIEALTPFRNGCSYKAYIDGDRIQIGYGCYGVHINFCSGIQEYLMRKLGTMGDPKIDIKELPNENSIPEIHREICKIEPCLVCGGTLFKKQL